MASPRGAYEASASETEETRSEGEVPLDRSLLFGADASGSPRASCADRADICIDDAWFERQSFDGHFEPFAATFHDDAWGDARAFEASDSVTSEGGRPSASTVRAEATDADDADKRRAGRTGLSPSRPNRMISTQTCFDASGIDAERSRSQVFFF